MEFEICGKETEEVKQIDLEGVTLIVCMDCASYGKEVEAREETVGTARIPARRLRPPRQENFDAGLEIVADYGKRISHARQARQITLKELAMKIFEKESLLHRIENQSIMPSDAIIEKLEKSLSVRLREKRAKEES